MTTPTSYTLAAALALFFGGGMVGFDLAKAVARDMIEREGEITFPIELWSDRGEITYSLCSFKGIDR